MTWIFRGGRETEAGLFRGPQAVRPTPRTTARTSKAAFRATGTGAGREVSLTNRVYHDLPSHRQENTLPAQINPYYGDRESVSCTQPRDTVVEWSNLESRRAFVLAGQFRTFVLGKGCLNLILANCERGAKV